MIDIYDLHSNLTTLLYAKELEPHMPIFVLSNFKAIEEEFSFGDDDDMQIWGTAHEILEACAESPDAEKIIANKILGWGKDGLGPMVWFATEVIGGRWPEAEQYIKQNSDYWEEYQRLVAREATK